MCVHNISETHWGSLKKTEPQEALKRRRIFRQPDLWIPPRGQHTFYKLQWEIRPVIQDATANHEPGPDGIVAEV